MTAGLAAVVGGWIGVSQYLKAERWKGAEIANGQVHRLWQDETLAFCCSGMDWGTGPLMIPGKYRSLFPVLGLGRSISIRT